MDEKQTVYRIELKKGDEWIPSPFHKIQNGYAIAACIAADDMRLYGVEWRVETVLSEINNGENDADQ